MNRRKKIKTILSKRAKQANLKENPKKAKAQYISKAERAKLAAAALTESTEAQATQANNSEVSPP